MGLGRDLISELVFSLSYSGALFRGGVRRILRIDGGDCKRQVRRGHLIKQKCKHIWLHIFVLKRLPMVHQLILAVVRLIAPRDRAVVRLEP